MSSLFWHSIYSDNRIHFFILQLSVFKPVCQQYLWDRHTDREWVCKPLSFVHTRLIPLTDMCAHTHTEWSFLPASALYWRRESKDEKKMGGLSGKKQKDRKQKSWENVVILHFLAEQTIVTWAVLWNLYRVKKTWPHWSSLWHVPTHTFTHTHSVTRPWSS